MHHNGVIEWTFTTLSLIGSGMNAYRRTSAFLIWSAANIIGFGYFLWTGQPAIAVLQITFLFTNLLGLRNAWLRKRKTKHETPTA